MTIERLRRVIPVVALASTGCAGGPPSGSGQNYEEYECPPPIGNIVREDCSKSALQYEGTVFGAEVGAGPVKVGGSYKESAIREADALVSLLKEQRVSLCNNFNTCKMTVAEYREDQRRIDDSFVALLALKDKMKQMDAEEAAKILGEIRRIRRMGGGDSAVVPAPTSQAPAAKKLSVTYKPLGSSTHVGGQGGAEVILECPGGHPIRGIHGSLDPYVASLGVHCSKIEIEGGDLPRIVTKPGIKADATSFAGQRPFDFTCPDGMVVMTVAGYTGDYLDGIQVGCGRPELRGDAGEYIVQFAAGNGSPKYIGRPYGSNQPGTTPFLYECRGFVSSITARSGSWLDGMAVSCSHLAVTAK